MERTWGITGGLLLAVVVAVAGCTGSQSSGGTGGSTARKDGVAATISAPANNATDVPASVEIVYSATKAAGTRVEPADAAGTRVEGAARPDGSSWVPAKQLDYGTRYTAKVTATGSGGTSAEGPAERLRRPLPEGD
jgi:hypothetical protein